MEHSGSTVTKTQSVHFCLLYSGEDVQFFHPLTLDMDTGEAGKVWDSAETLTKPKANGEAVLTQDAGEFQFPGAAFLALLLLPFTRRVMGHASSTRSKIRLFTRL